jgi:hypothetical protein
MAAEAATPLFFLGICVVSVIFIHVRKPPDIGLRCTYSSVHEVEPFSLLQGRAGAGCAARWAIFHLCENDRHLLPPDLSRAAAEAGELHFRTERRRGPGGRISALLAMSA